MEQDIVHANAIAFDGRALLVVGPSGSGKSMFSMEMMALGAALIADDRVCLAVKERGLVASCPETIFGQIEARNIGILTAKAEGSALVCGVLDLGQVEAERLPPFRTINILGRKLPLFLRPQYNTFAAAFIQYLKCDRRD